ncbi:MAG: diacylglycerol kinase family lipid kinase [Cyclobacteriaceae bacterium]
MKKRIFVVANPGAGHKKIEEVLRELVDFASSKDYDYDVYLTAKNRNGLKTVKENFEEAHSDLVILGGDGTINEAINGLTFDRPVGIVPCGSANDFCKNIKVGQTIEQQIQTAITGKKRQIDLGLCGERKFINGVGIGFDGQIAADIARSTRNLRGPFKYYYHVLRILAAYQSKETGYHFNDLDESKKLLLLTIANGTTFGGSFKLNPNAVIDDGLLDVCVIEKINPLLRFLNIPRLKSGSHIKLKQVNIHQTTEIKIDEQPLLNAHVDGELLGHPPFHIKVLPKALTIRELSPGKLRI